MQVFLDTAHPIASVSTEAIPGWTITTATTKLSTPNKTDDGDTVTDAVSQITWTAGPGAAIKPGQFQEFPVSLGPLPDVPQLVFKALQTYSDGSIVRWIDPTVAGQPEPDHPAPVLTLAKADGDAPSAAPTGVSVVAQPAATDPPSGSDGTARTLGGIGLALGVIALVVAVLGYTRGRRATS